jgi:glycopeptide antibiotics resistance protein
MNNENEDLNADSWKSGRYFYEDEAALTLKWLIGCVLIFLLSIGFWIFGVEIFKIFSLMLATLTIVLYLLFQAQVIRADMAQYHYISMLQNEKLKNNN